MEHESVIRFRVQGTPEEIRVAYKHLLDTMNDLSDIGEVTGVWQAEVIPNTRQHHRQSIRQDTQRTFLDSPDPGTLGPPDLRTP